MTRRGRFRPPWPFSGFVWPAKFVGGRWPVWPVAGVAGYYLYVVTSCPGQGIFWLFFTKKMVAGKFGRFQKCHGRFAEKRLVTLTLVELSRTSKTCTEQEKILPKNSRFFVPENTPICELGCLVAWVCIVKNRY